MISLLTRRGNTPPLDYQFQLNRLSPQARGLVGWWPVLATRSPALITDSSQTWATATMTDGALSADAQRGWMMQCNGSSTRADIATPSRITGNQPFTMSIWVRPTDSGDIANNVWAHAAMQIGRWGGSGNGAQLQVMEDRVTLEGHSRTGVAYTPGSPMTGVLHHVVGTWDGATARLYVNGIDRGNASWAALSLIDDRALLGCANTSGTATPNYQRYYFGGLDDARVYNCALSASEVMHIYRNPWQLYEPVLRYWPVGVAAGGGGATYDEEVDLDAEATILLVNQLSASNTATLAASAAASVSSLLAAQDGVGLDADVSATTVAALIAQNALALDADANLSAASNANLLLAIGLDADVTLAVVANAFLPQSISLAAESDIAASGGLLVVESVTLPVESEADAGMERRSEVGISLDADATVSIVSQARLNELLSLDMTATVQALSNLLAIEMVSVVAEMSMGQSGGLLVAEAISLQAATTVEQVASFVFSEQLGLPVTAAVTTSPRWISNNTLVLTVTGTVPVVAEGGESQGPILLIYSADVELRFTAAGDVEMRLAASSDTEI